ncbi:hypothetical protein ACVW1A_006544 [Bradyrhizobium sp. LB1.3]|uniref:hypothetical protein n=1 Tax=Bradyrhizobium sp. LB14.3 TaxID=3156328 RepID=UPI003396FB5C
MTEQFSPKTQELLDRAQRAIAKAIALRKLSRRQRSDAERKTFELEMTMYRERAQQLQNKN